MSLAGQRLTSTDIDDIKSALLAGHSYNRIQKDVGVSAWAVAKCKRMLGLNINSRFIEQSVIDALHELRSEGLSKRAIAKRLEIDTKTVVRYLGYDHKRDLHKEIQALRITGLPKRGISRKLQIDIATVRKYLKNDDPVPLCICGRPIVFKCQP